MQLDLKHSLESLQQLLHNQVLWHKRLVLVLVHTQLSKVYRAVNRMHYGHFEIWNIWLRPPLWLGAQSDNCAPQILKRGGFAINGSYSTTFRNITSLSGWTYDWMPSWVVRRATSSVIMNCWMVHVCVQRFADPADNPSALFFLGGIIPEHLHAFPGGEPLQGVLEPGFANPHFS